MKKAILILSIIVLGSLYFVYLAGYANSGWLDIHHTAFMHIDQDNYTILSDDDVKNINGLKEKFKDAEKGYISKNQVTFDKITGKLVSAHQIMS